MKKLSLTRAQASLLNVLRSVANDPSKAGLKCRAGVIRIRYETIYVPEYWEGMKRYTPVGTWHSDTLKALKDMDLIAYDLAYEWSPTEKRTVYLPYLSVWIKECH